MSTQEFLLFLSITIFTGINIYINIKAKMDWLKMCSLIWSLVGNCCLIFLIVRALINV